MTDSLTCFKAYDIRGRLGIDLDEGIARRIGRAFAETLGARRVVLGRDIRASSETLAAAVAEGLVQAGADFLAVSNAVWGGDEAANVAAFFDAIRANPRLAEDD